MSSSINIHNTVTQLQTATNQVNYQRGRESLGKTELDKSAFLQLLMAKLQMQDPLNPVNDADFLNQQAQLAQIEKMDNLARVMQSTSLISQAGTLVGKKVDVTDQFGIVRTGVIDDIKLGGGQAALSINGGQFSMSQITRIYND